MTDITTIQERAKKRLRADQRRRRDPRFQRVMGRFVKEGLLHSNQGIAPHAEPLEVKDVLWAGEVEPRLLELLPALLAKQPSMFTAVTQLPDDLAAAVCKLRRNLHPEEFRGIPGDALYRWLPLVGRKGKVPATPKTFRLTQEDVTLLRALAKQHGISETDVIRRGLRALLR